MTNKEPYPIEDERDFKGWRLMQPNAAKLLKEIVFRWRASSIRVKGKPGKWAVYPVPSWCEWSGLSSDQYERAARTLKLDGFIRRERHRFEGKTVRTFIQPTELALAYLGRPHEKEAAQIALAATNQGTSAGASAGTSAGTDYTYSSTSPTQTTKSNSGNSPSGVATASSSSLKGAGKNNTGKENPLTPVWGSLEKVWQAAFGDCYPGQFAALVPMHVKQLYDFEVKCPAPYAGNVLDWSIRNWIEFTVRAKQETSAFDLPDLPDPPFLLKFMSSAVNGWLEAHKLKWDHKTKTVSPKLASKLAYDVEAAVTNTTGKKPSPKPVDEKPKSLAELNAILAEP